MGLFSGAKDVKKATDALEKTVKREVRKNGGKPIGEDNAAYQRANKKANDAIANSGKAVRWWNGG